MSPTSGIIFLAESGTFSAPSKTLNNLSTPALPSDNALLLLMNSSLLARYFCESASDCSMISLACVSTNYLSSRCARGSSSSMYNII